MYKESIIKTLSVKQIPYKISGNNVMISCFYHHDKHPSFGISLTNGVYHCFSCGIRGNIKNLEIFFDIDSEISFRDLLLSKLSYKKEMIENANLPNDFRIYDNIPTNLLDRISEKNIKKFSIGYSNNFYPGYFIIPIKTKNYSAFVCRHLIKNPVNSARWLFPRNFRKILFPEYSGEIILTEGIISSLKVIEYDFNASSCFGHEILENYITQLLINKVTDITLLFDSYEKHYVRSVKEATKKLGKLFSVSIMKLKKDADEVSKEEFLTQYNKRIFVSKIMIERANNNFNERITGSFL